VSLHDQLVRSAYQVNVVLSIEFLYDVDTKQVASATWADHPPYNVIWIAPHKVCHRTVMRNFLLSVDHPNLVKSADRWRKTSVHAENFVVNNRSQCQVVKDLRAVAPHVDRSIFSQALVIKAIHLCNLTTFMIASNQRNAFRVADF